MTREQAMYATVLIADALMDPAIYIKYGQFGRENLRGAARALIAEHGFKGIDLHEETDHVA